MTAKQFTIYLNQRIAQRQTEKARKALMERLYEMFNDTETEIV